MGETHSVTLHSEPSGPDPEPQVQAEEPQESAIPEKFLNKDTGEVDTDALLASYQQLERKLSGATDEEEPQDEVAEEAQEEQGDQEAEGQEAPSLEQFSQEFFESGELSEDSYTQLEEMGYPKDLVDAFIAGQKAILSTEQNQLFSVVGGEEAYREMQAWASENMSDSAKNAYNAAVESGDMEQATLAIRGLRDSFMRANGKTPSQIQGRSSGVPTITGFRSTRELTQAMRDPRYATDPAYRQDVEDRLRMSDMLK